jgi:hypothetical protein
VTKKKEKQKKAPRSRNKIVVRDWKPLFAAVNDVIDWALDIAVKLSRDLPEEIESIEKVRVCFHAWLAGKPCEMDTNDLLITLGTILAAIEIDLGIDSVELLTPLRTMLDAPSELPRVLRFPGVERTHTQTVVIRRCPGARCASNHHVAA